MREKIIIFAGLCLGAAGGVSGADWPQFRGPAYNATSSETGLIKTFPSGGPKVQWSIPVGAGFGGAVVQQGQVYLLDRVTGEQDILRCFDLENGKEQWTYSYPAAGSISHPGSRSHPAVDDQAVYILGPFGDLHCVDKKSHQPRWKVNILNQFGGAKPHWAVTQCPLLYKDKVIVAPVGTQAGVVAFSRKSGEVIWQSPPLQGKASYASPTIISVDGRDQVLVITAAGTSSVDAETGKLLWYNGDWQCRIPIASPVLLPGNRIFVTGGYKAGAIMYRVVKKPGGGFLAETVFQTDQCNGQIQQPILYGDHLYLNGNDKSFKYGLMCMDLDGNVKWQTGRDPGYDWGGMVLADGMIYVVDGTTGDLCMVKPDPKAYREVARGRVLDGKRIWGTLALSEGRLLLRDQTKLVCVDLRK